MSQSIRPILTPVPAQRAADAAHRDRDLRRLLAVWRPLAVRLIAAEAHGGADEVGLCDALAGIEDALRHRHRRAWQQLQPTLQAFLLAAEHTADPSTPPGDCLVCRRIAGSLPSVAQLLAGSPAMTSSPSGATCRQRRERCRRVPAGTNL